MKEIILSGDAARLAQAAVKKARERFQLLRGLEDGEILRALVYMGMQEKEI